jgi:hypothetical protein
MSVATVTVNELARTVRFIGRHKNAHLREDLRMRGRHNEIAASFLIGFWLPTKTERSRYEVQVPRRDGCA